MVDGDGPVETRRLGAEIDAELIVAPTLGSGLAGREKLRESY
jgi:hypothetical protein